MKAKGINIKKWVKDLWKQSILSKIIEQTSSKADKKHGPLILDMVLSPFHCSFFFQGPYFTKKQLEISICVVLSEKLM